MNRALEVPTRLSENGAPMPRTQPNHSRPINPQLLRAHAWLLHRDKRPYYSTGRPRSGTLDAPEDLAKLATYDEALKAFNGTGLYTGLGIAINRGLQFIDLDKCRDPKSGRVVKWARALMLQAVDVGAYVEISMSGTGIHIVGYGDEIPTFKGAHIETYCHGRYMAMGYRVLNTGTDPLPDLGPVLDLMDIERLPRHRPELRLVATGKAPPAWTVERHKVPAILAVLNPDMEYPYWIKVGMALHTACGGIEEGFQMWEQWSAEGEKHEEGECARMWSGFKAGGGIGFGSLVYMAQGDGEPVSSRVTLEPAVPRAPVEFTNDELTAMDIAPTPWLVEKLLPPGLTLLVAPPKMGKSYFVLQMGLCVASGRPFLGRQTRQVKVSYFDLEEWPALLREKRDLICVGNGIDPRKVKIRYATAMSGGDITVQHDLQRHIDEGAELLIVDLLARVRNEVTEDAKVNAYARDYAALRAFADFVVQRNPHVALVIVHHTNKGNHESWQSRISGSQGLAGATHTNMLMDHVDLRGVDDDKRREALKYRRLHVVGKAVEADEMMLVQMPNGGGWTVTDKTTTDVKMQGKHAHVMQVLREANGAWTTAKDVHAKVEGTLDSVKKLLMRMAQKGEIQGSGSGGAGYRLLPPRE